MSFAEKLANVVNRHDEIQALLSSPDVSPDDLVRMNKEISELAPVVEAIHNYNRTENDGRRFAGQRNARNGRGRIL